MNELTELLGKEHRLDEINQALRNHVRGLKAPVVGALHVTCADESEWECVDSFQRYFVDEMLPSLKFAQRTPFRISNLGGRYEWGAIPVAEHHFATPHSHKSFKVLLIKINTHVAVTGTGLAAQYGTMKRYDTESAACGALHALLAGGDKPFLNDLREAFQAEGSDRLATLLDEQYVDPAYRSLFVALVNARRQCRRAEIEIQNHTPASPTFYLIASCCTLNRAEEDTELLCGLYMADCRYLEPITEYHGLGDDPARYQVEEVLGHLRITDKQLGG